MPSRDFEGMSCRYAAKLIWCLSYISMSWEHKLKAKTCLESQRHAFIAEGELSSRLDEQAIRHLGCWALGLLGTWSLVGISFIFSLFLKSFLGSWALGLLGTWAAGHLGCWVLWVLGTWAVGHLGSLALGSWTLVHCTWALGHSPWHISLFVLCCGTFCAVLWHILCLPVAHKPKSLCVPCSLCAVLWHILCLPVAHKFKSLFVPCCGTFCSFPWHILCLPVAHVILFPLVKNCKSRIASQELQVKNCKSRIASQELQVKNCKSKIARQEELQDKKNCKSRIAN
jgi:hypothetical protein